MLFTSVTYVLFLALVLGVYWSVRGLTARKWLLLAASYGFYAAWDWRFLSLILLSTVVDYVAARGIASTQDGAARRAWLSLSLVVNLGALATFKYLNFFIDSFVALLGELGVTVSAPSLSIILPVGISFYTFQTLSYTIDVYRRRLDPVTSLLDLAVFVGFFPQLVAGPIVRAATFLPQLTTRARFADVDVRGCAMLFLTGYVKKACVADNLALFVDPVFADPTLWSWGAVWLAAVGFTIQIYCDFSGYTDIAIASAGMLGLRLPPNFDFPFVSRDPSEFWRRWHISLSSWLRDYLYISLGGNRMGRGRTYANLMTTMLLGGLWHGAAWTFVVWGAIHGAALVVHRAIAGRVHLRVPGLGWAATTLLIVAAFVPFRAESLGEALDLLAIAGGLAPSGDATLPLAWWGLIAGFALLHGLGAAGISQRCGRAAPVWLFAALYGLGWSAALAFTAYVPAPFIYFQF